MNLPPLSVLDLAPIIEGADHRATYQRSVELAQHTEKLGYQRFWLAEHHNMPDIASAATSVLIGHIASQTKTIRVGSGGIMLPNHAPLVIAEQFGTLEALYPNRIDLGLGRAPGTDYPTMHALRRDPERMDPDFDELLEELEFFMGPVSDNQPVSAYPGANSHVPLWLLGSSTYSARLAAIKGLPFAFAAHFAPDAMFKAFEIYRKMFTPSEVLDKPYAMVCVNITLADTDDEAQYLATTEKQKFLGMIRGKRTKQKPPVKSMEPLWLPHEKHHLENQLRESIVGSPETAQARLSHLIERTQADEIMVNSMIYDQPSKLYSYELLASLAG
ncbi:LLM class flavin-dependent oxidoreductase [Vibrio nitrifigilis]|uniref:LLM class flavin-dependent oxidoreductase n=1 Tax=Vibrio nitrifigilis TaxID=2789781 RepID=A0ABS0GKQ0_9VIBR|nr:LLM class flavin-dependent oxidoreductase [Vibrio nitrifigilis]MBF9003047.1 LLM class flavin-dependent oxidoreductase [Vibrio nitrifigilis]